MVWGHEHECLIDPRYNPEMNFHVMQPGSSVATSLMPGEAVPKHVAVLSITGRDFKCESIRLKSVRPFVMKEIVLHEDKEAKGLAKKENNRTQLTQYLMRVVDELIEEAKAEWTEAHEGADDDEELEAPLPLVRLRVEYSAPDGGSFDCENPQRFSNRFVGKVANVNDVVQFYRKKSGVTRKGKDGAELPEESVLAQLSIDNVKVERLVREFLTAQSLTILPQNSFGDAVSQFVDKDDKHAMEMFVNESLANQIKHLMDVDEADEEELTNAMDQYKSKLEELFAAGHLKKTKKAKLKPRPENWDSDLDGEWGDQPGALIHSDNEAAADEDDDGASLRSTTPAPRGRGGRAAAATTRKKPAATTARTTTTTKKTPAAKNARGKKKVVEEDSEEEEEQQEEEEADGDDDIIMLSHSDNDKDNDNNTSLFLTQNSQPKRPSTKTKPATKKPTTASHSPIKRTPAARTPAAARTSARQSKLTFSQPPATQRSQVNGRGKGKNVNEVSGDEIEDDNDDDDEDAFEPAPRTAARGTRSRR